MEKDQQAVLKAVENFEIHWVQKPLDQVRSREGLPPLEPETLAERIKKIRGARDTRRIA